MKLNTPSDRFVLFAAITMMFAFAYQHYHIYQSDKNINEAIEQHNKTVSRYVFLFNESKKENRELKRDLLHIQSKNKSLAEQNVFCWGIIEQRNKQVESMFTHMVKISRLEDILKLQTGLRDKKPWEKED